jgi:hypothetical protein
MVFRTNESRRDHGGFYTESLLNTLEERKLNYIIAARVYPNIKAKIRGLSDWVKICDGVEVRGFFRRSESISNSKERRTSSCAKKSQGGQKQAASCSLKKISPTIDIVYTSLISTYPSQKFGTSTTTGRIAKTGSKSSKKTSGMGPFI